MDLDRQAIADLGQAGANGCGFGPSEPKKDPQRQAVLAPAGGPTRRQDVLQKSGTNSIPKETPGGIDGRSPLRSPLSTLSACTEIEPSVG